MGVTRRAMRNYFSIGLNKNSKWHFGFMKFVLLLRNRRKSKCSYLGSLQSGFNFLLPMIFHIGCDFVSKRSSVFNIFIVNHRFFKNRRAATAKELMELRLQADSKLAFASDLDEGSNARYAKYVAISLIIIGGRCRRVMDVMFYMSDVHLKCLLCNLSTVLSML